MISSWMAWRRRSISDRRLWNSPTLKTDSRTIKQSTARSVDIKD
jgi:hypothetical protein